MLAAVLIPAPAQAADPAYSKELVNGSFDYLPAGGWGKISDNTGGRWTSVDPVNGQYLRNASKTDPVTGFCPTDPSTQGTDWVAWPGFDRTRFGWESDQNGGASQGCRPDHKNAVELQEDRKTGNTFAELVGSELGKAILQRIDTQHPTDTVYKVRFDHASLSAEHADMMRVLVNGQPVTMTRTTTNEAGDPKGWTGTDIVSHATNTDRRYHEGQWTTYEGLTIIPANTPVSTFTFQALNALDPTRGNLVDNLSFQLSYPLAYDGNGNTAGTTPRQTN